jgi:large subunit ribosomal protein L31
VIAQTKNRRAEPGRGFPLIFSPTLILSSIRPAACRSTVHGPGAVMQQGIHPDYRSVIFRDQSVNYTFKTRSTVKTEKTIVWDDGETYPVVDVELSDMSHPFYTGKMKIVDTAGRVDRFNKRFGARKGAAADATETTETAAE